MRSTIVVRRLSAADVSFGLALSTAANWNQLEADWRRVVTLEPHGCFVASLDGRDVGTVSAVVFDSVAWIGLMLVDPSVRRRGVGRAIMEHALAWLEQRQVATVRLDATPLGQPLYEQLGFTVDYLLDRFAGAPRIAPLFTPRPPPPRVVLLASEVQRASEVRHASESRRPSPLADNDPTRFHSTSEATTELEQFDRAISGASRGGFLAALASEWPEETRFARNERDEQAERLIGVRMARRGRSATLIGPCLAFEPAVGEYLLSEALARFAGEPVFVDIPREHPAARRLAESAGLAVQRPLARMTRGPRVVERVEAIWASSGPEKG